MALAEKLGVAMEGRYAVNEEVRRRVVAGQSNGEIAEGMGLKYQSVKDRRKWIYKKEGVGGRGELVGR